MKLRKGLITANENGNVVGQNTGQECSAKNHSDYASKGHLTDEKHSDDDVPFGVPCRLHKKTRTTDTANWAWVEQVLKIKNGESTAVRGSQEVRMQISNSLCNIKLFYIFCKI